MAADGISRVGNILTATAIPWFVLVTTGSVTRTGLTVFVGALPVVLSLLFGGALVDRYSYRRVSIIADSASGLAVLAIPVLYHTIGLAFWQLLVFVFLGALLDTPAQVARYSALPDLARLGDVRFERANAIFDSVLTVGSMVAPALAGVLIVTFGASNVLWIDAGTFGVSILLLALLVPSSASPAPEPSAIGGYWRDFKAGLSFVRRERVLFPLVLFFAAMNLAIGPIDALFVPVYANEVFDSARALGLMAACGAVGALVGNLLFGWVGHRLSRRVIFALSFTGVPLALGLLTLTPDLPLTLAILAGLGLALSLANMLEYTIYFERIPPGMRARLLGLAGAIGWCTVPVGRLIGGVLLDWLGLAGTLGLLAALFLPVPLLMFVVPAFRDLRAPDGADESAPAWPSTPTT